MSELDPELLSAAGLAASFTADPTIWDQFLRWCRDKGYGEDFPRDKMLLSSWLINRTVREIQIELLRARLGESLSET